MKRARARSFKQRILPRRLHFRRPSAKQKAYQDCLTWWRAEFESGFSVPLAPRKDFPEPGERGCAFVFTDAAREEGTGSGSSRSSPSQPPTQTTVFMAEVCDERIRDHLVSNRLSMPAGEAIGAVALIDAVARGLQGLSHLAGSVLRQRGDGSGP